MVKKYLEIIKAEGEPGNTLEVRKALSSLRQLIKEREAGTGRYCSREALVELTGKDGQVLRRLLESVDAKTRKNAALLLGELGMEDCLPALYEAYVKEEQLFVRSSYLTAIGRFDYREYLPGMKERLKLLSESVRCEENTKHITEEMRVLTELLVDIEGVKAHEFSGFTEAVDMVLLTNRRHREVTAEQIAALGFLDMDQIRFMTAGVRLQTERLEEILPIRTYLDILFLVKGMKTSEADPETAAHTIVDSQLLRFLESCHKGEPPFYFRVEYKSKMPLNKKSVFMKRLAAAIELYSHGTLINTTSRYEFEIRLIENKTGSCNCMVKLFTIPDERFSYRVGHIAESIKPVNAALLTALAKEHMIEDARVLDPFCGVGTMLIERQKQVPGNTAYGLDILQEAVEKAAVNRDAAGQIIHFINRDFFTFVHEYLFDEIFTNMPFVIGRKTEKDIYDIYVGFFRKAAEHLTPEGTIILYSHNKEFVRKLAPLHGYGIVKETDVNIKEGTFLYVLKRKA